MRFEDFSLIIPFYQSHATIESCLHSVNKSLEGALNVYICGKLEGLGLNEADFSKLTIRMLDSKNRLYAGAARNWGAKESRSKYLIFLDADCIWNENWWKSAMKLLKKYPEAEAFHGPVFFESPGFDWATALHVMEFHEFLARDRVHQRFFHSGNLLIKRDLFEKIGGFREDLPACNDFTFAAHIEDQAWRQLRYEASLSITHLRHLVEKSKLMEKARHMGYWRARVEEDLPPYLQRQKCFLKLPASWIGVLFFILIGWRSVRWRIYYLRFLFINSSKIFRLCLSWAIGFKQGLKAEFDLKKKPL